LELLNRCGETTSGQDDQAPVAEQPAIPDM
jgi:hypothetical protein